MSYFGEFVLIAVGAYLTARFTPERLAKATAVILLVIALGLANGEGESTPAPIPTPVSPPRAPIHEDAPSKPKPESDRDVTPCPFGLHPAMNSPEGDRCEPLPGSVMVSESWASDPEATRPDSAQQARDGHRL